MNTEIDFDIEAPLPAWTDELSDGLVSRFRKLPPQAFQNLCQLGVEHWNNVAQSVGNSLKNAGFLEDELREVLTKSGDAYSDNVTERDIEKVVAKAWDEKTPSKKTVLPLFERAAFEKLPIETESEFLKRLGKPETVEPWGILETLFPGDPLLCFAEMPKEIFQTKKLSEWKADGIQKNFLVPSPMSKRTGITKGGKESGRCLANTGERKYLVIESDELSRDEQWILISQLATFAPLVMVLDTGNKSLHAWFECRNESEMLQRHFMAYAVRLGADKATWTRCQLVRLPGGNHANGNPHKILVFRPFDSDLQTWHAELIPNAADEKPVGGKFRVTHHSEIQFDSTAFDFVEDLLTEGGLSVIYAPPGAGKSYFVLDLAACVATGRQWRGKETKQGAVVYFCLEGRRGFKNRILALKMAMLLSPDSPLYLVESTLNFLNDSDVPGFIKAIGETLATGENPRMIVVDTLARSMSGGNENAGEDMGKTIEGANRLQAALNTHVLLVHHCGKDVSKGSRGHSSLKGAVDTEIELSKDETTKIISARVEKQKDLESGKVFPFKLIPMEIGMNERGKVVTACTLEHLDESQAPAKKGRPSKNSPGDLLTLLPQENAGAWKDAAFQEFGISKTRFYELKRTLPEGETYRKNADGSFSPVADEIL